MTGTALVTGARRGIGKAIATELATLGATVLMTVRDRARGEAARHHVLTVAPAADDTADTLTVSKA